MDDDPNLDWREVRRRKRQEERRKRRRRGVRRREREQFHRQLWAIQRWNRIVLYMLLQHEMLRDREQ